MERFNTRVSILWSLGLSDAYPLLSWFSCFLPVIHLALLFIYLFIYLFMAVLGVRFCARASSSCGKWGPLFIAMRGPLLLRSTGSRRAGSVVVAHGPSRSTACGILPDQGSNPCALHWQADSQPLRRQGSPTWPFLITVFTPLNPNWGSALFLGVLSSEHSSTHYFTSCLFVTFHL